MVRQSLLSLFLFIPAFALTFVGLLLLLGVHKVFCIAYDASINQLFVFVLSDAHQLLRLDRLVTVKFGNVVLHVVRLISDRVEGLFVKGQE